MVFPIAKNSVIPRQCMVGWGLVGDGEDCLLLARRCNGVLFRGWSRRRCHARILRRKLRQNTRQLSKSVRYSCPLAKCMSTRWTSASLSWAGCSRRSFRFTQASHGAERASWALPYRCLSGSYAKFVVTSSKSIRRESSFSLISKMKRGGTHYSIQCGFFIAPWHWLAIDPSSSDASPAPRTCSE